MQTVAACATSIPENPMKRKTLLTLAVLTAFSAGTAWAAPQAQDPAQPGTAPAPRAKLDANGDGVVDRTEAANHPRLAGNFEQMDKNQDGKLSQEEMPPRGERARGKSGHKAREMMNKLDSDQDGRISRAESAAGEGRLAGRFDEMDANQDGFIDTTDREIRGQQRRETWFTGADTDRDGKLSRAEMDVAKAQRPQR